MPRLSHGVPKYRQHRATGQAIVTLNGRDYYLGPHGTKASKLEYDRLITEFLASGRSPCYGTPAAEITVVELIAAYLRYAQSYYGQCKRSEFANMALALRPLRKLYGRASVREFGPLQLKAVRETFLAAGHSRKYINQNIRRIGRMFRWAVGEGLVSPGVPSHWRWCLDYARGTPLRRRTKK